MPQAKPDMICTHVQPGDAVPWMITITGMHTPARVTVSLRGAEQVARLRSVRSIRIMHRPATQQELEEAPTEEERERLEREGVLHRDPIDHPPGAPFDLEGREPVEVDLELSVPPQTLEGIHAGHLVLAGSAGEVFEVPVFCAIGRPQHVVAPNPTRVSCAVRSLETVERSIVIDSVPTDGPVMASLTGGRGFARIRLIVAYNHKRRPPTEDELRKLPDFPSPSREHVRRIGMVTRTATSHSNGTAPVTVTTGQQLVVALQFGPARGFDEFIEADLRIVSPRWQTVRVPVRVIVGDISVEVFNRVVSVQQGKPLEVIATIRSHSGPSNEAHFSLQPDTGHLQIFPPSATFEGGQSSTIVRLALAASHNAPVGLMPVTLVVRAYDQNQVHSIPLEVQILPGGLKVFTVPFSVVARQGSQVSFQGVARSEGARKRVTLRPGRLPEGVRMTSTEFDVGPGDVDGVRTMRLTIDRDAPPTVGAFTPIMWSGNNGIHGGTVNLPLTIELVPESRTFHGQFITPSGTDLGGSFDLEIHNDGRFRFSGHMHVSGAGAYDFSVSFFLSAAGLTLAITDSVSGSVGGTFSSTPDSFDWNVEKQNSLLRKHWKAFRDQQPEFSRWWENTGPLSILTSVLSILTQLFVARVAVGPATGAVLVMGRLFADLVRLPVTTTSVLPGAIIIISGTVFIFGPLAMVPCVVAGMAVALADSIKVRRMRPTEIAEAERVFGRTLPIDRIRVTNLLKAKSSGNSVAFATVSMTDNAIIIGMGDSFDDDLVGDTTFIHELTHAWQIKHRPFSLEDVAVHIERQFMTPEEEVELYRPMPPGTPWGAFGRESQASTVGNWYTVHKNDLDGPFALRDPYFQYIANHIRVGVP